ncbi:terpenoid synthase [Daedaleopsis nitida]|nr:terpenoid synthase [Daedaleopsis nitida]
MSSNRSHTSADHKGEARAIEYQTIPDLLRNWPWPRKINPLYEEVSEESNAWLRTFNPFTPKSQLSFEKGDLGRLSAMHLRVCCDLNNLFFLVDEYTDVESAPMASRLVDICIDATNDPHKSRPEGEGILGEVTRQFWMRAEAIATPGGLKHLRETFLEYLKAIVAEAESRDQGIVLDIRTFLAIRLDNVAVRPLCAMGELLLEIPEEIFDHPLVTQLQYCMSELIIIDNDILSYNREQATGLGNFNYLTVAMHEHKLDRNGATQWLVDRAVTLEQQYTDLLRRLDGLGIGPAQGGALAEYYTHCGQLRRASYAWSFECERYFGARGAEFEKTGRVPIIPQQQKQQRDCKEERVDVMLIEEEYERLLGPARSAKVY